MSAAEFSALCERNASNETVLRAAGSYAAQHDMIPYFRQYYRTPTERVDAFSHIIKTARVALDAQRQYCSALDPKHLQGQDRQQFYRSAQRRRCSQHHHMERSGQHH
ncbi:Uncharacterised protein [uncultured Clostridium sp.]|nr:Uncharacterised protein [uncultured Clostridium sp.]